MFEFIDEKLGRVKVINITEARASMAMIMNDKEFNYVITKNNRPVRVIINYDTYKKSQLMTNYLKGIKGGELKDPLKGLLKQKEKDLKKQVAETPVKKEVVSLETAPVEIDKKLEEPTQKPSTQESATQESATQESATRESATREPATEEPLPQEPAPFVVEPLTPPPSSDYFNRFRKLYEAPRYEAKTPPLSANQVTTAPLKPASPELSAGPPKPPTALSEPKPLPPVAETPLPRRSGGHDLPSIQDLLMDLENEKLSDENDLLSDNQINQLVGRLSK